MALSAPDNLVDPSLFRRILVRNTALPLGLTALVSAAFVGMVLFLISVSAWVDHADRVISELNSVMRLMVDSETGMRGFIISGEDRFLEPYQAAAKLLPAHQSELRELLKDEPDKLNRLSRMGEAYGAWLQVAQTLVDAKRAGKDAPAIAASGVGKVKMDEVRRQFDAFLDIVQRARAERIASTSSISRTVLALMILFTLTLGGLLAYFNRRQLVVLSDAYAAALSAQAAQNRELQEREWVKTGQARLFQEIRGDLVLKSLSERALTFLAHYAGAQVGALYVKDDAKGVRGEQSAELKFRRVAGHALATANAEETFFERERLLGQAAAESKVLHLRELPPGYLPVSSGLGASASSEVLIVPLTGQGLVRGVLELGALHPFSMLHRQLLEGTADALGMAIRAAQDRTRLEALLEETQLQSEELQSQQEELRVNNEELEEQTQALSESQVRLTSQKEQLERANVDLGRQQQTLELQAERLAKRNTELTELQKSLEAKARELELANRYKSEFLANMSHELRTPLNSTLLLVRLLLNNEKGNLDPDQLRYLDTVLGSSNDLLTLINDILDLSKVESGKLELDISDVRPEQVVETLRRTVEPLAKDKNLRLVMTVQPGTPQVMVTDRLRVEQVVRNFLSNALKFTERGAVTLTVGAEGKDRVSFSVADTGVGIPADKLELIYEPFRQADGRINRKYGGTGLGLSISRDLAALLGGTIETTSEVGKGSVFKLILPVRIDAPIKMPPPAALPPPPSVPRQVAPAKHAFKFDDDRERLSSEARALLVVEDDPAFAETVFSLAHSLGFQCLVAGTADEGVALAQQFIPSGILLDLQLPDHTGLTVLDRLKQSSKTRHIPTLIVSSADAAAGGLEMGAVGFLRKPVAMEQLRTALERLKPPATGSETPRRVLVVEDDPAQREGIVKLVGTGSVETVGVASGREALDALESQHFDCMITDLSLPDMEGDALLASMAQQNLPSRPPVIVYTGRALDRVTEDKLLHYSRTIVIKGAHSPERLLSEVTLFLHRPETRLPAEHQKMLSEFRSREKVFAERRILLVDDDVRNLFALTSTLEQKGARISVARNGREGIDHLQSHPETDLVLMDVMMPEMDGYEATRKIRQDSRFARLPVIMLTAKAMKDDQERAIASGANDYLAKPVELDKLLSLVRVWMPRGHRFESR